MRRKMEAIMNREPRPWSSWWFSAFVLSANGGAVTLLAVLAGAVTLLAIMNREPRTWHDCVVGPCRRTVRALGLPLKSGPLSNDTQAVNPPCLRSAGEPLTLQGSGNAHATAILDRFNMWQAERADRCAPNVLKKLRSESAVFWCHACPPFASLVLCLFSFPLPPLGVRAHGAEV